MSNIIIQGSTGSIGTSTLEVIRNNPGEFNVVGLSANRNISLLAEQIKEFKPEIVSVGLGLSSALKKLLGNDIDQIRILEGEEGNIKVAAYDKADQVVAAIVGAAGLKPVMAAIQTGKNVALANKEPIVLAGELITAEAAKFGVKLLPVDSEHNAIFQSLQGSKKEDLFDITLTASGGPFREWPLDEFDTISLVDALKHPNWEMGRKITIDSATMMNKCLEIIEARWLFDVPPEKINVIVHPQSIIHSMVTFKDGSTIAQLGCPDMKIPISYCLNYPERIKSGANFLDLVKEGSLSFEKPDLKKFPCLKIVKLMLTLGGGAPAAFNGANEALVEYFLREKIHFTDIFKHLNTLSDKLEEIFKSADHRLINLKNIDDAIWADDWGRNFIHNRISA